MFALTVTQTLTCECLHPWSCYSLPENTDLVQTLLPSINHFKLVDPMCTKFYTG